MGKVVLSLLLVYASLATSQNAASLESSSKETNPALIDRFPVANSGGAKVAAGTEIRATLDTPLSTKTAKPGDVFMATVTEPIRSADGHIVVVAGSRLRGEVSEPEPDKMLFKHGGKDKLGLHFSNIQTPDGSSIPLSARLISLTRGTGGTSPGLEAEIHSGKNGTTITKDIITSAAGEYVVTTNGKEVELPAQTAITLRLDHELSVSHVQVDGH